MWLRPTEIIVNALGCCACSRAATELIPSHVASAGKKERKRRTKQMETHSQRLNFRVQRCSYLTVNINQFANKILSRWKKKSSKDHFSVFLSSIDVSYSNTFLNLVFPGIYLNIFLKKTYLTCSFFCAVCKIQFVCINRKVTFALFCFSLGNNHMKEENYRCAVDCYTKAIDLDLRNAVYYCNRCVLKPDTRCYNISLCAKP